MSQQKYYTIVTDTGTAAITNALARGEKLAITHLAVGDANGVEYSPQSSATALKNEVWRGVVTKCEQDTNSPNIINIAAVIPSDVGGWTIREMGVYADNGKMITISNCDITKIAIADGAFGELEVMMQLVVSSTDAIAIKVDPTVILATKADIETHNCDPNAHTGLLQFEDHIENTAIHVSAEDRVNWDSAHELSQSNKVEIDNIWLAFGKHDSRLKRLEDAMFNDIVGNPWMVTFGDLDGVTLIKGCWNMAMQRVEV